MRDENREYDRTSLKSSHYGYVVHRDYAAHFFRWGWISRTFVNPSVSVLDIGCGVDAAMCRVLSHKLPNGLPKYYLGVDFNKVPQKIFNAKWADFLFGFNFPEKWKTIHKKQFDLVVCLEVVEHMRIPAVRKLLRGALALTAPGGRLMLSTPVFNGKMAKNHINEMTIPQLHRELDATGWHVAKRYGTFMSDNDRKKCATPAENELVDRLREYYSTDVLACFLAPLYPDHSRNNLWICERAADMEDALA